MSFLKFWISVKMSFCCRRAPMSSYQPERLRWVLVEQRFFLSKNLLNLQLESEQIISILLLQNFQPLQNCKWRRLAVKYSFLPRNPFGIFMSNTKYHFHVKYNKISHIDNTLRRLLQNWLEKIAPARDDLLSCYN